MASRRWLRVAERGSEGVHVALARLAAPCAGCDRRCPHGCVSPALTRVCLGGAQAAEERRATPAPAAPPAAGPAAVAALGWAARGAAGAAGAAVGQAVAARAGRRGVAGRRAAGHARAAAQLDGPTVHCRLVEVANEGGGLLGNSIEHSALGGDAGGVLGDSRRVRRAGQVSEAPGGAAACLARGRAPRRAPSSQYGAPKRQARHCVAPLHPSGCLSGVPPLLVWSW